tara:strand:+ start:2108 stop:3238 length:1131 start_codon:yes stop_codon:yes gene_type:complete
MSTLKVGAIRGVSASSDAVTVANDGTCTANITNNLSNKNIVINGAMQVAQRGDKTGATDHYGGCDRFKFLRNGSTEVTLSQDSGIPEQGFPKAQRINVTTADATMDSANYNILAQRIEGQDLQRIKKGTANAQQLTISFWIKSTITGTYILELTDNDNSRHCCKAYTVSSSNTWEKKEITFPADTTGEFSFTTNLSMEINWWFGAGSTYAGGTLQTTWGSQTNANRAVGGVNAVNSTSNNIYLTGVQLEVGSVATDFEHRSFSQELTLCQRYYQQIAGKTDNVLIGAGRSSGTTTGIFSIPLAVPLRATPTVNSIAWAFFTATNQTNLTATPTVEKWDAVSPVLTCYVSGLSSMTNARCLSAYSNSANTFTISAEL